jgi:hypothetical protein
MPRPGFVICRIACLLLLAVSVCGCVVDGGGRRGDGDHRGGWNGGPDRYGDRGHTWHN